MIRQVFAIAVFLPVGCSNQPPPDRRISIPDWDAIEARVVNHPDSLDPRMLAIWIPYELDKAAREGRPPRCSQAQIKVAADVDYREGMEKVLAGDLFGFGTANLESFLSLAVRIENPDDETRERIQNVRLLLGRQ